MKGINCEHSLSRLYARIGYRHRENCCGGTRRCWIKQQHLELWLGSTILTALSWKSQWGKCSTTDCLRMSHHISWAQHRESVWSSLHHRKLNSNLILNFSRWQKSQLMRFVSRLMVLLYSVRHSQGPLWLILCATACTTVSSFPLQRSRTRQ